MTRILRIETHNFRGAPDGILDVAPAGLIAAGRNGAGKTSLLRAIRAGLGASDATADAVRTGADEARVVLRTDDYTVTRRILPEGRQPAVKVETTGPVAAQVKRPAEFLAGQTGHGLDPLAFYLADGKLRREMLLAALPVVVTEEQLRAWDPSLPPGYPCAGHGLEVLARRHQEVYAARAVANKAAEESARKARESLAAADACEVTFAPSMADAEAEVARTRQLVAELVARSVQAQQAAARSAGTRARVEQLRVQAASLDERVTATGGDDRLLAEMVDEVDRADTAIALLEQQLADLRAKRARTVNLRDAAMLARDRRAQLAIDAAALRAQADDLETALDTAAPAEPTGEDCAAARGRLDAAEEQLTAARAARHAEQLRAAAEAARTQALADQARADALGAAVRTLQREAPAALVAAAPGLTGLALTGDAITLNGVSLDGLSSAEQLRFAVDLAKRLGAGAPLRVLTVDGLERVDPEHLDDFVGHCIDGGWQLFATLVERGELVIRGLDEAASDDLFS